jgi:hypothetical protein
MMLLLLYTNIIIIRYMKNAKIFALTFPPDLLADLDRVRGDVPRSRYLRRLVERDLMNK